MKDLSTDNGRRSGLQTGMRAALETEKPDPAKLAATILENQAMIEKGWEELRRLSEMLALLDTLKASVRPTAAATVPARKPEVA